jgi:uncharacterized protein (TIGR04255 family)
MVRNIPNIHLDNPPIIEALIDIQASVGDTVTIDDLEALHAEIQKDYPTKTGRYAFQAEIKAEQGKAPAITQRDLGINGFLFRSKDEKQIVQFRLDGFTFSRLRPYQDWEHMRDEAKKLWGIYVARVMPRKVSRLAVRYINLVEIQEEKFKLDDYFETYLKVPNETFPEGTEINGFASQVLLSFPSGANVIINQGTVQGKPRSITFDIDVFLKRDYDNPNDPKIWEMFDEHFRDLKDDIFTQSFTKKGYQFLKGAKT